MTALQQAVFLDNLKFVKIIIDVYKKSPQKLKKVLKEKSIPLTIGLRSARGKGIPYDALELAKAMHHTEIDKVCFLGYHFFLRYNVHPSCTHII